MEMDVDEWYELAGSDALLRPKLYITYYRPSSPKEDVSGLTIKVMKDMYIGMITIQQILITQHG